MIAAEWEQIRSSEREMTICIAAACNTTLDGAAKIILCTDWRVSGELGSAETMHKQEWLRSGKWWCLTAGSIEEINATMPFLKQVFDNAAQIDETNIKQLIEESLRERLSQKRDSISYARYSMSYKEVYDSGKIKLPDAQFVRFISETSLVKLDAEFIIAGFYNDDAFILRKGKQERWSIRVSFHA